MTLRPRVLAVTAVAAVAVSAPPADANTVRITAPSAGQVVTEVVTVRAPRSGSTRPKRALRVANARRLAPAVAVYAAAVPACSAGTRGLTVLLVATRDASGRGARSIGLEGSRVRRCASYPLLARLGNRIPRLRCDRLSLPPANLLLGADATCIAAVQREIAMPSPFQLPLSLDIGTRRAPGPAQSHNFVGTAEFIGEPRPGRFAYAFSLRNRTPAPYAGVPNEPLDQMPNQVLFYADGTEEGPNVAAGPTEMAGFQCRVEISPGLPGSLTCRQPRGAALPPQLDFQLEFDARLPVGPTANVSIGLPRYGEALTEYVIDVTR